MVDLDMAHNNHVIMSFIVVINTDVTIVAAFAEL